MSQDGICSSVWPLWISQSSIWIYKRAKRLPEGHVQLIWSLIICQVFLDNLLIFSRTVQEHSQHLHSVLDIIRANNISINTEKSNFFQREVWFMGHQINQGTIRPLTDRILDAKKLNSPRTKKQLLHTLDYLNWFRPFIQNLSFLVQFLIEKTRNDYKFL